MVSCSLQGLLVKAFFRYPDNFNCAKYWHCSAEKGDHFMCATGLEYEATKVGD